MKVVLVSLEQVRGDKAENRRRVAREMERVCERMGGVAPDLVIFPEMTLTGFTMRAEEFGEEVGALALGTGSPEGDAGSPTIEFFSHLAKKYNTYMAFGLIVKEPDANGGNSIPGFTNNLVVVDKDGRFVTRYQKIHPFSYSGEDKYYRGGEKLVSFSMNDWTIGLTVCYDLRFPELYQGLSRSCHCILNIANWPSARVAHWRTLLRARAIENQCYMLGVNRSGVDARPGAATDGIDANHTYEKSSLAIDPLGEILSPQPLTPISDLYEINLSTVTRIRAEFPFKNDRKPSIYKNICL